MEEGASSMNTTSTEMGEMGKGSSKKSTQTQQQNIPTHLVKMFKVSSNFKSIPKIKSHHFQFFRVKSAFRFMPTST
jgi:hypothetical protein